MNYNENSGSCHPNPCKSSPQEACQICFGFEPGHDGPQGPQGPKGPAGEGIVQPYDPSKAPSYKKGMLIWYGGLMWEVNTDNPQGIPGNSPDYTMIDRSPVLGATGPTGPQGEPEPAISQPYSPDNHYKFGDIIYYHGELYLVTTDNPQGAPGSGNDYTLITGLVVQGVTGPTGPTGGSFPQVFDPNNSCSYKAGMLIYYKGNLYKVLKDCPQGTPGSSCDYSLISAHALDGPTGPQGPEGDATAQPYDPNMTYYKGDVIYYNGALYWVNKDNPEGTPGSSPDYTHIDYMLVQGMTGPTGEGFATAYDPEVSNGYPVGQLVYYNGDIYEVNTLHPQGTPGESSDYTLVAKAPPAETGPQGITGPEGPPANCECRALIDENTNDLENLQDICDEVKNEITNITNQIDDTEKRIEDDQKKAQDNADRIANLKDKGKENACVVAQLKASIGQYGCGDQLPFEVNSATYTAVPWAGTESQMLKQGSIFPTGGTFFGCKVYRAVFYGMQSNVLDNITCGLTSSGYNSRTTLLPSCIVSTIVDAGGWYTQGDGTKSAVMTGNFYLDNGYLTMETDPAHKQKNQPYYVYVDFTCCSTNSLPTCPTAYCLDCSNNSQDCTNAQCAKTSIGKCGVSTSGATGTCACKNDSSAPKTGFNSPAAGGCNNLMP